MKKIFLTGFIAIIAITVILPFLTGQAMAQKNLLLNPGFEKGDHIDYWINDGTATFNWVADWHPQEGKWSFGVGNDLEWAKDDAWGCAFQVLCDPDNPDSLYPVILGEKFTFEMWIKGEENYKGKASLKLEFFGYDRRLGLSDEPLASFQSESHTGQFDWLQEIVKGTAPKDTVSVVVSCLSENMPIGSAGGSYVWFDGASVTVIPVLQ